MGDQDNSEKIWMSNPQIFASIFNNIVFKDTGIKVDPENIQLYGKTTTTYVPDKEDGANFQIRDVSMVWESNNSILNIIELNIENQTAKDVIMPYRVFNYNSGSFYAQLGTYSTINKKLKDLNKKKSVLENSDNSTSNDAKIAKIDKDIKNLKEERSKCIYPVCTIVLYFGSSNWTYPHSLYDMWGITKNGKFKKEYEPLKKTLTYYLPNYTIPIIEVRNFTDEQIDNFDNNIKAVFKLIKESFSTKIINDDNLYERLAKLSIPYIRESCLFLSSILKDNRYNEFYRITCIDSNSDEVQGEIEMTNILDYAEAKGEAKGEAKSTKETIMRMIEQNYTKEQILAIFNKVSEDLYTQYLNEYKESKINN